MTRSNLLKNAALLAISASGLSSTKLPLTASFSSCGRFVFQMALQAGKGRVGNKRSRCVIYRSVAACALLMPKAARLLDAAMRQIVLPEQQLLQI